MNHTIPTPLDDRKLAAYIKGAYAKGKLRMVHEIAEEGSVPRLWLTDGFTVFQVHPLTIYPKAHTALLEICVKTQSKLPEPGEEWSTSSYVSPTSGALVAKGGPGSLTIAMGRFTNVSRETTQATVDTRLNLTDEDQTARIFAGEAGLLAADKDYTDLQGTYSEEWRTSQHETSGTVLHLFAQGYDRPVALIMQLRLPKTWEAIFAPILAALAPKVPIEEATKEQAA